MAVFKKYEFDSEEQYFQLKESINNYLDIFVELGNLRNNKFSVDVLWSSSFPEEWEQYSITDMEGNGSHTFLGYEFNQQTI